MSQSRMGSFVEAWINVAIGFGINFVANMLILPMFGFHISAADNLKLGVIYTVISVSRGYAIRRWFNGMIQRAATKIAA